MPENKTTIYCSDYNQSSNFELNEADTFIYYFKISDFHFLIDHAKHLINKEELKRAQRYYHKKDRDRFIVCRTILKLLLEQHTNILATKINIKIDSNKKPYVDTAPTMFFNISHSGEYAAIVFSNTQVGIDIEKIKSKPIEREIITSIFNNTEADLILNTSNTNELFYKLWTRKEALVKASGIGIDDDFKQLPSRNGTHNVKNLDTAYNGKWEVFSLNLVNNYHCAFAINLKSSNKKLKIKDLTKNKDYILRELKKSDY
ncbi:hypothetical protein PW52_15985 [Tamlana sedimentorum]|uniref:Uncharacterized protein n=1 Tax=Neotamlana sedimentorum TaxID=1435349 RepID=A0A0D7VYU1_9FLAO|nr:4'-phosphopantetheinyl transferase superfamily protein [Tamlana sedimentorum]KJD32011.1 hypothetical protein PW52_15985 [Tamlana sedimentorum]